MTVEHAWPALMTSALLGLGLALLARRWNWHVKSGDQEAPRMPLQDTIGIAFVTMIIGLIPPFERLDLKWTVLVVVGAFLASLALHEGIYTARGRWRFKLGLGFALIAPVILRPFRLAVVMVVVVFICGAMYSTFGLHNTRAAETCEPAEATFLQCMYFSVVTVTTLGYGDFAPKKGPSRVIAASEAVFGYFAFALFIASVLHRASSDPDVKKYLKELKKMEYGDRKTPPTKNGTAKGTRDQIEDDD